MKRTHTKTKWPEAFVDWTLKHGRWIWAVAILLAIPAVAKTADLYLHLKSELEELLPRESPSVRALQELRHRYPGLQYLSVVVDFGDPEKHTDGDRFVDELAAKIRHYPPDLVRGVRTGNGEERAFLEGHAPLYIDLPDLKSIRERIEARRDWEVGRETGMAIDEDTPAPPLHFDDIQRKYDERLPKRGKADGDRFSSRDLHLSMLLVEVGFESGTSHGKQLMDRVKADVDTLRAASPDAYAKMRVGYASDVAISVEELDSLVSDLAVSSVLVLVLVATALILYYRWARCVLVLVPPLLIATAYSFALASVPPFRVNALNSNTAFLGAIIVGNGINFGIVLLARYIEQRRKGDDTRSALITAVGAARAGTLSAALGASVAYGSLVSTQFRGFRQFGIIGGIGMLLSWVMAFVCMPPLIAWVDRGRGSSVFGPVRLGPARTSKLRLEGLARFVQRHAAAVATVGLVITGLAVAKDFTFGPKQLEYDLSKLRRRDTMVRGEGYWGARMDALLGRYLTPTVLITNSVDEARAVATKLRAEAQTPPLSTLVADVRTIDDVLPLHQEEKIAEASAIRDSLTPKIRSLLTPEQTSQLDRVLGPEDLKPVTLADLPHTFTIGLVEWDGTAGRSVLMFPHQSQALWDGPQLASFVAALRAVGSTAASEPARVAGALPLSADIFSSLQRDGLRTSLLAFAGVLAVVLVMFRRQRTTLYVIGSLSVAVICLLALLMLLRVKINFANFIAFPITFGIGVDYAVNVMSRYAQDHKRDMVTAVAATGSAVALCSLTTIIGYSSLLVAQNRALFLFGLVAVLGEITCLMSALTLLPAVVRLVEEHRARTRPRPATSEGE